MLVETLTKNSIIHEFTRVASSQRLATQIAALTLNAGHKMVVLIFWVRTLLIPRSLFVRNLAAIAHLPNPNQFHIGSTGLPLIRHTGLSSAFGERARG
jgi:hypothetical protein